MEITARRVPGDHPHALELVRLMIAELDTHYTWDPAKPTPSATPADLSPPGGAFVVLYDGERPVAGGGVKRLADDTGEIKRMYVLPEARGQGLARRLLAEIEAAARDLGYTRVRLDTGPSQPDAEHLYRTSGYTEIGNYNDNAYASYWAEKIL